MPANLKQCATCEGEIVERFVNIGGPVGSMSEGWEHSADGTKFCRSGDQWFNVVPQGETPELQS